jgi:radical SAM superfamily enzyme YgiQ (UPF0313 family)
MEGSTVIIKLISPKVSLRSTDSAFKRYMAPPLALLVLGALTPSRHEVVVEDENVERLNLDDAPDLVGITVKADTFYRACGISAHYRARGVPVILGGIHPTACPGECMAHADSVVIGEAEEVWEGLLLDAERGELQRTYRKDGKTDLSRSPAPRWDLIRGKNYLYTNTLCAGRGCPWQCDFCYSSAPNIIPGHRMKPVEKILAEVKAIGNRQVMFIDDNFIGTPEKARALLRKLAPLKLTWHTAVSADIGRHDDILDLMAESGCKSLYIGFETLNGRNLRSARKGQNRIEEYARTIAKIHSRRMMVNASLVFGFDDDGPDVFERTLQWLVEQKIETMTAHILTPYPGTRLYARLLSENRIIDFNLRHYNTSRVVFRPKGMSPDDLRQGYLWMYRNFYSWRRILARLPDHREQWTAYLLFNLFYRKFGKAASLVGRLGLMGPMARLARRLSYPDTKAAAGHGSEGVKGPGWRITADAAGHPSPPAHSSPLR